MRERKKAEGGGESKGHAIYEQRQLPKRQPLINQRVHRVRRPTLLLAWESCV